METIVSFVLRNQSLIREGINATGMILCAVLSIMIAAFMFNSWYNSKSSDDWSHMPGVPTACAMLWIFSTESYRCAAVWHIYRFSGSRSTAALGTFAMVDFWPTIGYLIAGFGLCGGLLRCTYLFTPPHWRDRVWKIATASAVCFNIVSYLTS